MSDQQPEPAAEAAFIDRITPTLREPVQFDATFSERVMASVRAESHAAALRDARTAWWRRPRTFSLSPFGGFALATGFAGIVALATLAATGSGRGLSLFAGRTGARDTVHVVRFVFVDRDASRVAVSGDFNGWSRTATPLARTGVDGVWAVSLPMARGRHQYAFVVDSTRWSPDPLALAHADEYGTESSVVTVGERSR